MPSRNNTRELCVLLRWNPKPHMDIIYLHCNFIGQVSIVLSTSTLMSCAGTASVVKKTKALKYHKRVHQKSKSNPPYLAMSHSEDKY